MTDLIENVTFLAGAASCFDRNEEEKKLWANIFSETVSGVIRNVHTPVDDALKTYRWSEKKEPIGLNKVFYGENSISNEFINLGKFKDDIVEKHNNFDGCVVVHDLFLKAVSKKLTFNLRNYNIRTLPNVKGKKEIGHSDYIKNLHAIISYVQFDF